MHLTYPASIITNPSSKEEAQAFQDLNAYCTHYNKIERKLYVDWTVKKKDINILKQDYQQRYNLNARQFNSMRIELQGKVDSILEINKAALVDSENTIKKLTKTYKYYEGLLAHLIKSPPEDYKNYKNYKIKSVQYVQYVETLNKYKTLLIRTKNKLQKAQVKRQRQLEMDNTSNPHLCFGSKKLYHQQFLIDSTHPQHKQSVFESHDAWKERWEWSRHHTFFVVGSNDEPQGNQNAQLKHLKDTTFELKINLKPKAIKITDRYTTFKITIHRGNEYILQCLNAGEALSYRFFKEFNGTYRILISLDRSKQAPKIKTLDKSFGTVGIDINADHISVAETDRFGNLITRFDIPCNCKDKTNSQSKNIIALAVKEVITFAEKVNKPMVVEELSFVEKKKSLISGFNKKYNSMISSFAYNKILTAVHARTLDKGIETIGVNPAYTSIIGHFKYQGHRKLTTHQAAAYVIARRGMYSTEINNVKKDKIVTKKIINKENRISPKLEKHYPYPLPDWTKVGEGSFSFWSKMKQAEKSYRNKTPKRKKVEVHLVSLGESSHLGDASVKN